MRYYVWANKRLVNRIPRGKCEFGETKQTQFSIGQMFARKTCGKHRSRFFRPIFWNNPALFTSNTWWSIYFFPPNHFCIQMRSFACLKQTRRYQSNRMRNFIVENLKSRRSKVRHLDKVNVLESEIYNRFSGLGFQVLYDSHPLVYIILQELCEFLVSWSIFISILAQRERNELDD